MLKISTFTASVALLIGGSTIHSLIGLSIDRNIDSRNLPQKNEDWSNFHYLIIDEVSMVGYTMLTKIHLKLQKLKSSPLQPFGGLSIMFLRVFMQFPPISDTPLYTYNAKPPLTFTKQTQKEKIIGKSLWENYVMPNKIILTQQMQQNENIQYAQLLNNVQENKITKDDYSLLKSCFLSKLQINLLEHPWNEATYIVPWNE